MKCKNCGEIIPDDSKYCELCGTKQGNARSIWLVLLAVLFVVIIIVVLMLSNSSRPNRNEVNQQDQDTLYSYTGEDSSLEVLEEQVEEYAGQDDDWEKTDSYSEPESSNSVLKNRSYYRVNVTEARIYDYMSAGTDSTYMSYLNLVYKRGATIEGEIVYLPNHGEYLMVTWNESGTNRRGFVKLSDVNRYDEYKEPDKNSSAPMCFRVTVEKAKIYEYASSGENDNTYMLDLNLSYPLGTVLQGEMVELPNHGHFLKITWLDSEGNNKRGFIKSSDVMVNNTE